MQFNPGDGSGIVDEIDALCDSDPTSYLIARKTSRVNNALEEIVGDLMNADGTWEFDDTNYTNMPIGVCDLVDNQSQYTFDGSMLEIDNVKILDINGIWHIIKPWDQSQSTIPQENYLRYEGFPVYYAKLSNTISLLPPPKSTIITLSGGLKVQFKRTASLFVVGDTTKAPGFASPFHSVLAYMAAIPYCMTYKKDRVSGYQQKVTQLRSELIAHYGQREKDRKKVMRPKRILFR